MNLSTKILIALGLALAVIYGLGPKGRRHLSCVREMLTAGLDRLVGFLPIMESFKGDPDGVLGRAAREIKTMGREEFKNVISFALKDSDDDFFIDEVDLELGDINGLDLIEKVIGQAFSIEGIDKLNLKRLHNITTDRVNASFQKNLLNYYQIFSLF